jgi:hypothetical protein
MNLQQLKQFLWQPTGGYYLFWTGFVYFWISMYQVFIEHFAPIELIQIVWLVILALPLVVKPLARRLNMRTIWENNEN